jgi:hypothetical protein
MERGNLNENTLELRYGRLDIDQRKLREAKSKLRTRTRIDIGACIMFTLQQS